MKENISSVEYANNWYGGEWEKLTSQADILLLKTDNDIDQSLLISQFLEKEIDTTLNSLLQNLIYSGQTLSNLIEQKLLQLNQQVKEQVAALFLREKFGPPGDPLVATVFAELAQREVLARQDSKTNAQQGTVLIEKFEKEILFQFQLLIANQINLIEKEARQYRQTKKDAETISRETPAIKKEMIPYQEKFNKKFTQFATRKRTLKNLYQIITKKIGNKHQRGHEQIVFELANQKVNPSPLPT